MDAWLSPIRQMYEDFGIDVKVKVDMDGIAGIAMLRVLKGNDKAASSNLDSTDKSIKKKKILLTSHISAV